MKDVRKVVSIVVPAYNEAAGIAVFHKQLMDVLQTATFDYEVLYVDDGSTDDTTRILAGLCSKYAGIRLIKLTRNFGKEIATTAGIHAARGDAVMMIDADGQHPVTAIPEFVAAWMQGSKVVLGVSTGRKAPLLKRIGSTFFYSLFSHIIKTVIVPHATDFRLIDKTVQADFNRLTEHNRITRGLIDWLGYEQTYVIFTENPRSLGQATQSFVKLFKLTVDSVISLSTSPLYVVAYIGAVVLPLSTLLGLGMAVNYVLHDPLHIHATGGAYLLVLILFLIGILLVSQGIIGLYLSHIYSETQNRPLYVVDDKQSKGL